MIWFTPIQIEYSHECYNLSELLGFFFGMAADFTTIVQCTSNNTGDASRMVCEGMPRKSAVSRNFRRAHWNYRSTCRSCTHKASQPRVIPYMYYVITDPEQFTWRYVFFYNAHNVRIAGSVALSSSTMVKKLGLFGRLILLYCGFDCCALCFAAFSQAHRQTHTRAAAHLSVYVHETHRQQWNFVFAYFKWSGKCLSGYLIFNRECSNAPAHTRADALKNRRHFVAMWKLGGGSADGRRRKPKENIKSAIHSVRCVHLSWKSQPVLPMNGRKEFRSLPFIIHLWMCRLEWKVNPKNAFVEV